MKKVIIASLLVVIAWTANAKPHCQGFNNYDDKVTIVFTDDNAGNRYTVTDVKLIPSWNGEEYTATSVKTINCEREYSFITRKEQCVWSFVADMKWDMSIYSNGSLYFSINFVYLHLLTVNTRYSLFPT